MPEKTAKPEIEDIISNVLTGNTLKTALNFIAYLRENRITLNGLPRMFGKSILNYLVCVL